MSNIAAGAKGQGTAVILGASGAVGKNLLSELLSSSSPYTTVYSFSRRPHPSPPTTASGVEFKEIIVDFEKVYTSDTTETAKLSSISGASSIFITMGTTRGAAGSMSAFEKIDRGYVLSAAKALTSSQNATLVYCSSGGSSSSSLFPYLKSKGLTEEGLAQLYPKTIIMRPGYLANAERPGSRILERLGEPLFTLAAKFSNSVQAPVTDVAKAMVRAAQLGPEQLKTQGLADAAAAGGYGDGQVAIVGNASVLKLAQE